MSTLGKTPWNKGLKTGPSWNKGKELSAKHRANITAAQLGKKRGPQTATHRAAISAAQTGKNGPSWKGDDVGLRRSSQACSRSTQIGFLPPLCGLRYAGTRLVLQGIHWLLR